MSVKRDSVGVRQGRHARGRERRRELQQVAPTRFVPAAGDGMPHRGRGHDHRQGHEAAVQVRQDRRVDRDQEDGHAPSLVLPLAIPERQVEKPEREQVRPDQEMNRPDRLGQDRHDHSDEDRDAVPDQPARHRGIETRQSHRRQCDGRRPAPVVDHGRQQQVEAPGLIDPGIPGVGERQCVLARHGPGGADLATQPQVPRRAGIIEQPMTTADQHEDHHDEEDQVAWPGSQAAGAIPSRGRERVGRLHGVLVGDERSCPTSTLDHVLPPGLFSVEWVALY